MAFVSIMMAWLLIILMASDGWFVKAILSVCDSSLSSSICTYIHISTYIRTYVLYLFTYVVLKRTRTPSPSKTKDEDPFGFWSAGRFQLPTIHRMKSKKQQMPMTSKSRTKYLIECLSAMHLYHFHRGDGDDDKKRQRWEGKLEHTCYNCGRQFVKSKSSFLHLKKRMHRCPCCQTEFGHGNSVDGGVKVKDSDNRSGRSGHKNGVRLSAPLLIRSILAIAPLRKRKEQSYGLELTTTTTVNCSKDNTIDDNQGDDLIRRRKEISNGDVIASKSSCPADGDPCPFSFTYDDETVERYQIHESNDESETLDVETYQFEWLLFDV